jgi:benzoyl-CoA-dihydrodiol lyase
MPDDETASTPRVDFQVHPSRYRHWRLATDGPVATLTMDVDEQGGLVPATSSS